MALNVNRWLNYAKARIDAAVGSGHESLDRLEAKQEADRADKPWLASDSTAPTFDEARARIAWEADQQAKQAERHRVAEDADQTGSGAKGSTPGKTEEADEPDGPDAKEAGTKAKGAKGAKADTEKKGSRAETGGTTRAGTGTGTSGDPAATRHPETDRAPATSDAHDPDADDLEVDSGPPPRSPQQIALDAERETARLELEDRQQKSAERLAEIRRELGIDGPPAP